MFVYMGHESSYTFFTCHKKATLIGTNMVMICGLHDEDFEKPIQMFHEGNNFPVVTLDDLIYV